MEFSRKTYLDRWIERKHNGLVKILTGIHGCGKSYLLRKLFRDHLIKSGVASDHICVYEFPRSSDRSMCSPDVFFADLKKRLPRPVVATFCLTMSNIFPTQLKFSILSTMRIVWTCTSP